MDRDLVVRAQHGDQRAFEALTAATHPRLYRLALGVLRDPSVAEDATQRALIHIWRHLRRLRDPARFDGWSYRLLVNACHDEAKRMPKWVPDSEVRPADEPLATDAYRTVIDRDQLERGFSRLPVEQRAVIVLHHLLDLPLEQVADALDVPVGTVGSRLTRAMRSLRAALEADARPAVPIASTGAAGR